MNPIKSFRALGLMSGTSIDGVDAAIIETDGIDVFEFGKSIVVPYDDFLRDKIHALSGRNFLPDDELVREVELEVTKFHADIVNEFLDSNDEKIDVIGFHGHTIYHDSKNHYTHQIGDGQMLANLTGIKVVNHFRDADICAGGEGAPIESVYHLALCSYFEKPIAVLNIGGISSLTWMGRNGEFLAFDTGPGNAPINDWVLKHGGMQMDYNGKMAITGSVNGQVLSSIMRHKYFAKYPPKSADRDAFKEKLEHLEGLRLEDGAATVTAFVAESIAYSMALYLPEMPKTLIVCGGGSKNPTLLRFLRQRLEGVEVQQSFDLGWNSEVIEAQAFAYLAVRRLHCMPISYPTTTGVAEPIIGGKIFEPKV